MKNRYVGSSMFTLLTIAGLSFAASSQEASAFLRILPFAEAELFLEENTTDGDLGLHFKVDGEGWDRLVLTTPRLKRLLDVRVSGNLGNVIGLTEIFSESAEPGFDELPREEFLELFPPGIYFFFGKTLDKQWLIGLATLTHHLPAGAGVIAPEEDEEVSADEDLVIEWEPVADPHPPSSVIEFYEIVCEKDEDDERLRVFSVHMLPDDTTVRVPSEFLEEGKDYKVEIISQETSGNRSAAEVSFSTEGGEDDEEEDEEDEE